MTSRVLMVVDEYLRTSFDGADCEYLDGEVVERNIGERLHGLVQGMLVRLLGEMASRLGIELIPEIRIQITSHRYRLADLAVWRSASRGERIPKTAPFLAVEILSPEDRMVRMQPKISEYLSIGVEWVWVIDPDEKKAICYSRQNPAGVLSETLRTDNPAIEISLADVFNFPA